MASRAGTRTALFAGPNPEIRLISVAKAMANTYSHHGITEIRAAYDALSENYQSGKADNNIPLN